MYKSVVIFGSTSGLGKELVKLSSKSKAKVYVCNRKIDDKKFGKRVVKIECDVRDQDQVEEAFKFISKDARHIDLVINCVGVGLEKPFEETSLEEIRTVIETNLTGALYVSNVAYKKLVLQKAGVLVNIASTSGRNARINEVVYCASKWGMVGMGKSLMMEGRSKGVQVVTVCPGGMKTNFFRNNRAKDVSGFMDSKSVAEYLWQCLCFPKGMCPAEIVIERMT
jgi:short-subunit dehydrogenase